MAGILRESMTALVRALRIDPILSENLAQVVYSLEHPSKAIRDPSKKFYIRVEPAGMSQLTGRGALDFQYFFWVTIQCRPSQFDIDGEDRLSFLAEYLGEAIHARKWGVLHTYLSKAIINYRSFEMTTNSRNIRLNLSADEIGAVLVFWQSRNATDADNSDEKGETV